MPDALWRISNRNDLDGLGGEKCDGRWHTAARGKRIVYLSEHPAVALLEVLANLHLNPKLIPETYQLLKIGLPQNIAVEHLINGQLSEAWRDHLTETQSYGDNWLAQKRSALLVVPSVPSPESLNYLFNPTHPDAPKLRVEWSKWIKYDRRLFHTPDFS